MAGDAFQTDKVEHAQGDGVRLFVPLLDGTDRIGVLAFSPDTVDDHDRRLARRLAGLVADVLVTKSMHTDRFFQARRRQPMSLSAEMQWRLLPPLMMTTPQVAVAGALEPAYDVAGDSFDYALNGDVLHPCMIDVMGHGLDAAVMATLASVVKPMPDQVETCEVDHPQLVRSSRGAAALDQVWGTLGGLVEAANPAQSDARGAGEGALLRWFQLRAILDFRIHANIVQWASDDGKDDSAGLRAVRVAGREIAPLSCRKPTDEKPNHQDNCADAHGRLRQRGTRAA